MFLCEIGTTRGGERAVEGGDVYVCLVMDGEVSRGSNSFCQ